MSRTPKASEESSETAAANDHLTAAADDPGS